MSDMNQEDQQLESPELTYLYDHFCHGGSCVAIDCECGITHFTTAPGHGDYEEGEMELYRSQVNANPVTHVEWFVFDTIHTMNFGGNHWVLGCRCGRAQRFGEAIIRHADEFTAMLSAYWKDQKAKAERLSAKSESAIANLQETEAIRKASR